MAFKESKSNIKLLTSSSFSRLPLDWTGEWLIVCKRVPYYMCIVALQSGQEIKIILFLLVTKKKHLMLMKLILKTFWNYFWGGNKIVCLRDLSFWFELKLNFASSFHIKGSNKQFLSINTLIYYCFIGIFLHLIKVLQFKRKFHRFLKIE